MQAEANARIIELRKERDLLKALNESLLQNTEAFKTKTKAAETSAAEANARVADLEEQVDQLRRLIHGLQAFDSNGHYMCY